MRPFGLPNFRHSFSFRDKPNRLLMIVHLRHEMGDEFARTAAAEAALHV